MHLEYPLNIHVSRTTLGQYTHGCKHIYYFSRPTIYHKEQCEENGCPVQLDVYLR
jgi:hypothetical protein